MRSLIIPASVAQTNTHLPAQRRTTSVVLHRIIPNTLSPMHKNHAVRTSRKLPAYQKCSTRLLSIWAISARPRKLEYRTTSTPAHHTWHMFHIGCVIATPLRTDKPHRSHRMPSHIGGTLSVVAFQLARTHLLAQTLQLNQVKRSLVHTPATAAAAQDITRFPGVEVER